MTRPRPKVTKAAMLAMLDTLIAGCGRDRTWACAECPSYCFEKTRAIRRAIRDYKPEQGRGK